MTWTCPEAVDPPETRRPLVRDTGGRRNYKRIEVMTYLFCKHKVAEYARWRRVFDSHAEAQHESGLHVLHVLRAADDPNLIVMLFRVDDVAKARAFTEAPSARETGDEAGVIGPAEMFYLND